MTGSRDAVVSAAATLFAERAFTEVTVAAVAVAAGVTVAEVRDHVGDVHDLASAVLAAEGTSMRDAMARARQEDGDPLLVLARTFRLVGENMAARVEVRAGMRLAAESHRHFPERDIDPYRTWRAFVTAQLAEADRQGLLRAGIDRDDIAQLLVAAGMGTKDLLEFRDSWTEAPARLEQTARFVLGLVTTDASVV